jgi:glutathione-regulated potassium-efflux system protein KefB
MEHHASAIPIEILVFLGTAVLAPILFKRLGLGSIVGYLIFGILFGPAVLGVFKDPVRILHIAEFGVVLLLFLIGLEIEPSRLLAMRKEIIRLGFGQLAMTTAAIGAGAWAMGLPPITAGVVGFAFSLSSTAVAIQVLNERGHLTRSYGQKTFSVLLSQDLAVVPALALVPALDVSSGITPDPASIGFNVGIAVACILTIILAGRFLIDPVLRLVARSGAREIMVATALLLVAGAAVVAESGGLSMALGAFLAGLLLSESSYKHELEINIEPFRGILLAMFFVGVGMSLDIGRTIQDWPLILIALAIILTFKVAAVIGITRISGASNSDAIRISALLAPTSEFAFVFLPLAARHGLLDHNLANGLSAVGVLSMMMGPPIAMLVEKVLRRQRDINKAHPEETLESAKGAALVIGFGRFGQMVTQLLLSQDVETTMLDGKADRIRLAAKFGFKVYYGDASRLDVLRAAGAGQARIILVCVEDPDVSLKVVDLVKANFPLAKLLVRSYDRAHSIALQERGVDYELRELLESSIVFGRVALEAFGVDHETATAVEADVRHRDLERLALQRSAGLHMGTGLLHQKVVRPEPLVAPVHKAEALNAETEAVVSGDLEEDAVSEQAGKPAA